MILVKTLIGVFLKMPFCRKCGKEFNEKAKYCPSCGSAIISKTNLTKRKTHPSFGILAIFFIILIVSAATIIYFGFVPFQTVKKNWAKTAQNQIGFKKLILNVSTNVALIKISFENLTNEPGSPLITLDVNASAKVGFLVNNDFLDLFQPIWDIAIDNEVFQVRVGQIESVNPSWPLHRSLNISYNFRIDPSLNVSLNIKTNTGGIILNTQAGVVLEHLNLEVTTGLVKANLIESILDVENVSLRSTTGTVDFSCFNIIVTKEITIKTKTITGGVSMNVTQKNTLSQNITVKAETITGAIDFKIDIEGNIGAKIESTVTTGGITINTQIGFTGPKSLIMSNNYPSLRNFNVSLTVVTGGININSNYSP
jgi:hypothetical protein